MWFLGPYKRALALCTGLRATLDSDSPSPSRLPIPVVRVPGVPGFPGFPGSLRPVVTVLGVILSF